MHKVRERVPITQSHRTLIQAVHSLLNIGWAEVKRREEVFRQWNGSVATLPDFQVILDAEESQGETFDAQKQLLGSY
jgi:hypothetical protein